LDGAGQTIHLNSQLHIVLRVEGDSMNLANIDDGDYILLRLQNDVSHEDIVAAQITEKEGEPQATLKRFERDGKKINLKAESSNPKNKSYPFTENDLNHRLSIIGVAIGVFKPNNTWTREN
jgi:SOS-response transcriptional repressor LexA